MKVRIGYWFVGVVVAIVIVALCINPVVWEYFILTSRYMWTFKFDDGRVQRGEGDFRENNVNTFLSTHPLATGEMRYETKAGVTITKYDLLNGKKHGNVLYFSRKGQLLRSYNYIKGVLDGEQWAWWGNGKIMSYEVYSVGKANGTFTNWYESGKLSSITSYSNGAEYGENLEYSSSGRLLGHCFVSNYFPVSGTVIIEHSENKGALIGRYSNSVLVEKWYALEKWK